MSILLRHAALVAVGFAMLAATASVRADTGAVFVVPSRPGVPVAINGRDASWSVVEGDFGLARPGHMNPTIIGGGRPLPPRWSFHRNSYYPRYGVTPQRGRHEIDPGPDRMLPEPAETYTRSWSTSSEPHFSGPHREPRPRPQTYHSESEHLPATIEDHPAPPPIVVVPHRGRRP
jgi:hypothetical protein